VRGQSTLAITFDHSKDHRPDLKQLLYILTVTEDGGVPIYFTSASGNTSDDTTHQQTRDVLCQLVGRSDFLYVADCKLASTGNMNYIARQRGCFITVLPRTRKEDQQFRQRLLQKPETVAWQEVYVVTKQYQTKGQVFEQTVDRLTVCSQEILSQEGYRLLWYHSTKQAENDARRRAGQLQRATHELTELRDRLQGSKTRFGKREKVEQAVQEILKSRDVEWLLSVDIIEQEKATYRQARRGLWPCFERTVTERGTGSYFPLATRSFAGRIGQVVIKRTILKKRTNDLVIRPLRANSLIKPSTCVRAARLSRRAGAGGLVGGGEGF